MFVLWSDIHVLWGIWEHSTVASQKLLLGFSFMTTKVYYPAKYDHTIAFQFEPGKYNHTILLQFVPRKYSHTVAFQFVPRKYNHTTVVQFEPRKYSRTRAVQFEPGKYNHTVVFQFESWHLRSSILERFGNLIGCLTDLALHLLENLSVFCRAGKFNLYFLLYIIC